MATWFFARFSTFANTLSSLRRQFRRQTARLKGFARQRRVRKHKPAVGEWFCIQKKKKKGQEKLD